jgi:hypothetical protein
VINFNQIKCVFYNQTIHLKNNNQMKFNTEKKVFLVSKVYVSYENYNNLSLKSIFKT